ncbi:MAG TPA: isocyanide synthase family protein [Kofleriaceae bacterium]|nr:isocyanide synthase family protein [Kofleriaceae bacterium]
MSCNAPIQMVLPAFPMKSPNRNKTLGPLPDMGERLALRFLQWLCTQIRSFYAPGARIVIASDGRVFNDLVGVPDAEVTEYQHAIEAMIHELDARDLSVVNLDHVMPGRSFSSMRDELIARCATSIEELREEVRAQGSVLSLYRGIARFLFEDGREQNQRVSNTAWQKQCRVRAYGVIQRSRAWGELIGSIYPDALRLSIHPQTCTSSKLGIHLAQTRDAWLTPWHGVLVFTPSSSFLMKRWQAERHPVQLVNLASRPSHFVLPHELESSATVPSWQHFLAGEHAGVPRAPLQAD